MSVKSFITILVVGSFIVSFFYSIDTSRHERIKQMNLPYKLRKADWIEVATIYSNLTGNPDTVYTQQTCFVGKGSVIESIKRKDSEYLVKIHHHPRVSCPLKDFYVILNVRTLDDLLATDSDILGFNQSGKEAVNQMRKFKKDTKQL